MASTRPLFSAQEVKALELDRKRYLANTYVTTGIPLSHVDDQEDREEGIRETMVTTEIEKTTAVTTVKAQQCCPTHGQGCEVDHGATLYGTTYTRRSGKLVQLPLREDTGSGPNWLPRALARELQCELRDAGPNAASIDFGGGKHIANKKVTISLNGIGDRVEEVEFYIPPDRFPLQCAVLGRDFIQKAGHPYQCFPDKPDTVGIIVQTQVTVSAVMLDSEKKC
jgi:hypothetical protein